FRADNDLLCLPNRSSGECRFKTGHDVLMPVKIGQWLSFRTLVDHGPFTVLEDIVHFHDVIVLYFYGLAHAVAGIQADFTACRQPMACYARMLVEKSVSVFISFWA